MSDIEQTTDKRLIKGQRARATIARHAADVASAEGLTGLSLGRLADDLGMSKSGVSTLFGTKEKLQLAAVQSAREVFIDNVVTPSFTEPRGMRRLTTLINRWLDYVSEPVLSGGCFRVATTAEFDSRTGAVHDAIQADNREWSDWLENEIREAQAQGHLEGRDPHELAFELNALVTAANTGAQMGDDTALPTARSIIDGLLAEAN